MYLIQVGLNATLYDHETKELARCYSKGALRGVELHVVLLQDFECLAKMIKVLISTERLDEHVIYVDFHGVSKLVCEHFVDQSLVGCTCVLQIERHDLVAKCAPFGDEHNLLLPVWVHEDLIVA